MIDWFVRQLQRFVQLGIDLVVALIGGLVRAPFTAATRAGSPIVVRSADPEEVVDLRHRILRAGLPRQTAIFSGDDAETTRHWVAVQADRVVGVATVLASPMPQPPAGVHPTLQLRGMAVEPNLQGEGVGTKLLLATHDLAPLWCNARAGVVGFYEKYGWKRVGPAYEIEGIGPHQRMWFSGD